MKKLVALLLIVVESSLQQGDNSSTLKYVHVVFRHGDRTPDSYCSFFNPTLTETFWPQGFGALTLAGKNREYNIGTYLRRRYNSWLGDVYYPDIVFARSTDTPRTKMSLELVLAGLFPPSSAQTWNWEVNWQPIPYTYQTGTDTLMGFPLSCSNYTKEFSNVYNTSQAQNLTRPWKGLFDYVVRNSKPLSSNPVNNVYFLYSCLLAWEEMNMPLQNWTKLVYPGGMKNAAMLSYRLNTLTPLLTKLSGGQLLGKVLSDGDAIAAGKFTPATQKIGLFSGHEYNIGYLLRALKAFDPPQWPNYGSFIIFELHNINSTFGYKIFLQNYKTEEALPIVLPGCAELCPVNTVKKILIDSIPDKSVDGMC